DDVDKKPREDWSVTLSHETLELIANPYVNLLVEGSLAKSLGGGKVFYHREVCDPVPDFYEGDDKVRVSNFVLPQYFCRSGAGRGRVDFLGANCDIDPGVKSLEVKEGGYLPYFDPKEKVKMWVRIDPFGQPTSELCPIPSAAHVRVADVPFQKKGEQIP